MTKVSSISRKTYKKNIVVAIVLSVLLATSLTLVGMHYVYSQAISNPGTTYGPGDVDAYSYIVYREGDTYYAKNGTTRAIDYSGTDASEVIQNALDFAGEQWEYSGYGGTVALRQGTYVIDTTIMINYYNLALIGEGMNNVILDTTGTCGSVIAPKTDPNTPMHFRLEKLTIDGYSNPTQIGIDLYSVNGWQIRDVRVVGFNDVGGVGTRLFGDSSLGCDTVFVGLDNVHVSRCTTGILFEGTTDWFAPNANTVRGGQIQFCPIAINLSQGNGNHFYSVTIENPLGSADTAVIVGDSIYPAAKDNTFIGTTIESYEYGFNFTSNAYCNIVMATKFYNIDSQNCWNDNGTGGVKANWLIGQGDTTGDYLGINWVYFDQIEGWSRSGPILSNYHGSLMLKGSFYPSTDEIYWLGTANHAWAGAFFQTTEPDTTGWGANEAGCFWYDKDDNRFEYWNGTHILYIQGTVQP